VAKAPEFLRGIYLSDYANTRGHGYNPLAVLFGGVKKQNQLKINYRYGASCDSVYELSRLICRTGCIAVSIDFGDAEIWVSPRVNMII
jgi:hypothetical protein